MRVPFGANREYEPADLRCDNLAVCTFCQRTARDSYALTRRADEWERLVASVCGRCLALLRRAGDRGRRLKGTGETWWLCQRRVLFLQTDCKRTADNGPTLDVTPSRSVSVI